MELVAKFEGSVAERHILPAFEGSQSLEGLSRALLLTTHYVVTGNIRKKYPFHDGVKIYIKPPRAGSFETVYSILSEKDTFLTTTFYGTLGVGVFGAFLKDTIELVFKRLIGGDHKPDTEQLKNLLATRGGDLEALGDAVEPALKKAHSVINHGAGNIVIISGSNNVVNFDANSKRYLNTTVNDGQMRQKNVSCGMLNVNTRNGRVYDNEFGRTIPIKIPRDAAAGTLAILAGSLQKYSSRAFSESNSEIGIIYTMDTDQDGVVKRYIVYNAFEISS